MGACLTPAGDRNGAPTAIPVKYAVKAECRHRSNEGCILLRAARGLLRGWPVGLPAHPFFSLAIVFNSDPVPGFKLTWIKGDRVENAIKCWLYESGCGRSMGPTNASTATSMNKASSRCLPISLNSIPCAGCQRRRVSGAVSRDRCSLLP